MSHKHCHYCCDMYGSYGFLNPYILIILILIVLQWNRIGGNTNGAFGSEPGLVSNGGLFIITLFLLVYCSCGIDARKKRCGC